VYYDSFDFLCVMDMDLQGDLAMDGLYHSMYLLRTDPHLACVTGNGMLLRDSSDFFYYDSFAHVEENEPILWENMTAKSNHDRYVHTHVTQLYSTNMNPDRVRSAFGGIALYRIPSILKQKYGFSRTHYCCEHSFLHDSLSIVVNPRFIFLIQVNAN